MPIAISLILTEDTYLSKVDKTMLSQQTLMELLIEGIENRARICGSVKDPKDISAWVGVYLNDEKEVKEINWDVQRLDGSLHLEWLPLTIETVSLSNNSEHVREHNLVGTLDLTSLPESLQHLRLFGHRFEGSISLTALPDRMEYLNLTFNELSGSLDLTALPPSMKVLGLAWNKFSGVVDFSQIPASLRSLDVSHNTMLEGVIRLQRQERFAKQFADVAKTLIETVYY